MRFRISILSTVLLAMLLAAPAVADDVVWLKSGDRITGKIVKKDGDHLIVKPNFGGEVKIPLKEIRSFQSDRPLEIKLADGKEHAGSVKGGPETDVTIEGRDDTEFRVPDVAAIASLRDPAVVEVPDHWTGRFYGSLAVEDGNTQKKGFHLDGIVVGKWKHDRLTLQGDYNYSKENGNLTDQNAYGQVKYDYFLTEDFYLFAASRISHDKFQDLSYRWTTGPGAGYQWLKKDKEHLLETEGGLSWTREDRTKGERNDGYMSANAAVRGFVMLTDGVRFSGESLWLFNLDEGRKFVVRSWAALDVTIIKNLALTGKVIWDYENSTPRGVEHNDWTYLLGITWTAF